MEEKELVMLSNDWPYSLLYGAGHDCVWSRGVGMALITNLGIAEMDSTSRLRWYIQNS